jgi:alkanesulfonate monooxygenase SsuD/methylene tetrahydromethanopterin reductase-like flavin-dependent oxidoreductase (luciferase family)
VAHIKGWQRAVLPLVGRAPESQQYPVLNLLRQADVRYVGLRGTTRFVVCARRGNEHVGAIKFGIRWPDFDVPIEVGTVRAFIHAAEDLGFDHVTTFDHIAGVSDDSLGKSSHFPPHFEFGEAMTMIACMAGITNSLGFLTDILNVGYRPTALTAKQVGTIDHLTNGKMRLGLGIGAVPPEYDLMGVGHLYKQRGARVIEQIEVLRLLWTDPEASFDGEWHSFKGAGSTRCRSGRSRSGWE